MGTTIKDRIEFSLLTLAAMVRTGLAERASLAGTKVLVQYEQVKSYNNAGRWRRCVLHEVSEFTITRRKSDGCLILRKNKNLVSSWSRTSAEDYGRNAGVVVYKHWRSPHNYDLSSLIDGMTDTDIRKLRASAKAAYCEHLNSIPIPGPSF